MRSGESQYRDLCANSQLEQAYIRLLENPQIRVVSFDLFDTLFFRRVASPQQIFLNIGRLEQVTQRFGDVSAFVHYRIAAEQQARKVSATEEVTLADIYQQIPLDPESRQAVMLLELEEERRQLYPNAQLERWVELAKAYGKKVIVTSDIYLSAEQLGYVALDGWAARSLLDGLYISSVTQKTKASGSMFLHIQEVENLAADAVLHIGDKADADVAVPEGFGLRALHYAIPASIAKTLEHEAEYVGGMDETGNDIRRLTLLLDPFDSQSESFFFHLGAHLFGPVLWSFSHWLIKLARVQGIHQVVSVMREGRTFHRCLQHCLVRESVQQDDIRATLLNASRKSTYLPALQDNLGDAGAGNFYRYRHMSVSDLYRMHDISPPDGDFAELPLSRLREVRIGEMSLGEWLKNDFAQRGQEVDEARCQASEAFRRYCEELEIDDDAIMVDFGGTGSVLQQIGQALGKSTFCDVLFFMHDDGYRQMLSCPARPFLPLNRRTVSAIEAIRRSPEVLELLLNGTAQTTLGYTLSGNGAVPVLDERPIDKTHARNSAAFDAGIDAFMETAFCHDLERDVFSRERLTLMLGRLVEMPESEEAEWLGAMPLSRHYSETREQRLIDTAQQALVARIGAARCYRELGASPLAYYEALPWPQGAITLNDPECIRQLKGIRSTSINQNVMDQLLNRVAEEGLDVVSVFGAGEFFRQLLPQLVRRGIRVNLVVDSRAYTRSFSVEGYAVITPEDALKRGERTFVIASAAFAKEMAASLRELSERPEALHILSV